MSPKHSSYMIKGIYVVGVVDAFFHSMVSALTIVNKYVSFSPAVLLLNDDTGLDAFVSHCCILAGLYAANSWHSMEETNFSICQWYISLLDILSFRKSIAKLNYAKRDNIYFLDSARGNSDI